MSLELVSAPTLEPLSLDDAKAHLRVDGDDESALIENLITAARQWIDGRDGWLGRQLITATWDLTLDRFPDQDCIRLLLPPVQSVTSISYIDSDGAPQVVDSADYSLGADLSVRPRVNLAYGASWPQTREERDAVTVRFVAGYGAKSDVPAPIRAALLVLVATWYENREAVVVGTISTQVPLSVEALLAPYRIIDLLA